MRKEGVYVSVVLVVLILSISLVSAFSFSDVSNFFKNLFGNHGSGITGNVISTPQGLGATVKNATEIDLTWTAASGATSGYWIYRGTVRGAETGLTGRGVTNYADITVVPGTTYYYKITALNATGNSTFSNTAIATTPSASSVFNFSMSNEGNKVVNVGSSVTNTITLNRVSGTSQAVSFGIIGIGPGFSVSNNPLTCTPSNSCTTTYTFNIGGATPKVYPITIYGTSADGLVTQITSFNLTVNSASSVFNFSMSNEGNKVVNVGSSVTNTITLNRVSGTSQAVSFGIIGIGPGFSVSNNPLTCTPSNSCTTTYTFNIGGATPKVYPITIYGTSADGLVTQITSFNLTVNSASSVFNFSMSNEGNKVVNVGSSVTNTITLNRVSGTSQAVSFGIIGIGPGFSVSNNPLTCTPSNSCTTTYTFNIGGATPKVYPITIYGTSADGLVTQITSFNLTVNSASSVFNFSMSNEGNKVVNVGSSVTNTITLNRVSGTSQAVSFGIIGIGPGFSVSNNPLTCTPSNSCTTTYTFNIGGATPKVYPITIYGTSADGLVTQITSFNLTVNSGSTQVNGACGSTNNACTAGTLTDIADNSTSYIWQCVGSNGGTTATCSLLIPTTVTYYNIAASTTGNGTGLIQSTSSPPQSSNINCGVGNTNCLIQFASGTNINLTAIQSSGSTFTGWGGDCAGSLTNICVITGIGGNKAVSANFVSNLSTQVQSCPANALSQRGLTGQSFTCSCSSSAITSGGTIWGTNIYTDDSPICRAAVHAGAITNSGGVITYIIQGSQTSFVGSAQNGITTMSYGNWQGSYSIGISTILSLFSLNATANGNGQITSSPLGIGINTGLNCGAGNNLCTVFYSQGTNVTLSASTSNQGYSFLSWGGSCSGNVACNIIMNSNASVIANFVQGSTYLLNVTVSGNGTGTVSSSPSINCGVGGTVCQSSYAQGTLVTLTASASNGNSFINWTGCDVTSGNICNVTMGSNKYINAVFYSNPVHNPPNVIAISPEEGDVINSLKVNFVFNVTANSSVNCSLSVGTSGSLAKLNYANLTTENRFSSTFGSNGNYNYSISCTDTYGITGKSDLIDFSINASSQNQDLNNLNGACTPNWQYGNWGACISGTQTRTVTDVNNCNSITGKPPVSQSCLDSSTNTDNTGTTGGTTSKVGQYVIDAVIVLLIIATIAAIVYFVYYLRKNGGLSNVFTS